MSVSDSSAQIRLAGLDVLRLFAALFVLLYHLTFYAWASPGAEQRLPAYSVLLQRWFGTMFEFGWVGVEIFFVISGYVICRSAERQTPKGFAFSRSLRLLPTMWICAVMLTGISYEAGAPVSSLAWSFAGSIFFQPLGPWASGVFWTLQVEMFFYGLVFLLLAYVSSARLPLFAALLGLWSLCFWSVFWLGSFFDTGEIGNLVERIARHQLGAVLLLRHGCFFALGIWLAYFDRHKTRIPYFAGLGILFAFCLGEILQQADNTAAYYAIPRDFLRPTAAWIVAILFLVASRGFRMRGTSGAVVQSLGQATYPLYLVHMGMLIGLLGAFERAGQVHLTLVIVVIPLTMGLALVIAGYLEPLISAPIRQLRIGAPAADDR